jgi:hypothetical protein
MRILLALMLLAGAPFWEDKSPEEWTDEELQALLHASPWAKTMSLEKMVGKIPAIRVYLASARPMQDAEDEAKRRMEKLRPSEYPEDDEYRDFLRENPGKYIVLAVALPDPNALTDAKESRKMEEESFLRAGRARHKMEGHFPPTPSDPFLRLIFPRAVGPQDKSLRFELYLPSVPAPYRSVEFYLEDLLYKGRPEM